MVPVGEYMITSSGFWASPSSCWSRLCLPLIGSAGILSMLFSAIPGKSSKMLFSLRSQRTLARYVGLLQVKIIVGRALRASRPTIHKWKLMVWDVFSPDCISSLWACSSRSMIPNSSFSNMSAAGPVASQIVLPLLVVTFRPIDFSGPSQATFLTLSIGKHYGGKKNFLIVLEGMFCNISFIKASTTHFRNCNLLDRANADMRWQK